MTSPENEKRERPGFDAAVRATAVELRTVSGWNKAAVDLIAADAVAVAYPIIAAALADEVGHRSHALRNEDAERAYWGGWADAADLVRAAAAGSGVQS